MLLLCAFPYLAVAGVPVLTIGSGVILRSAGFQSGTAIWLVALVAFFNFAFTIVGLAIVDRAGRRRLTLGAAHA